MDTRADSLSQILIGTFQPHVDGALQLIAAEVLFDMYSIEHCVLDHAKDSYLLTSPSNEETARKMNMYATYTDKDQLLKKMLKKQVSNTDELCCLLDEFSSSCVFDEDETKANICNQKLAYSSGMLHADLIYHLN